jgi:hypothetical protein
MTASNGRVAEAWSNSTKTVSDVVGDPISFAVSRGQQEVGQARDVATEHGESLSFKLISYLNLHQLTRAALIAIRPGKPARAAARQQAR